MKWKLKCPVVVTYLPVPALWKEIRYDSSMNKKLIKHNGIETVVKFAHKKSSYEVYCTDTPREEGLGTAKLFMGMVTNDVTVSVKGGAICNNYFKLLHLS